MWYKSLSRAWKQQAGNLLQLNLLIPWAHFFFFGCTIFCYQCCWMLLSNINVIHYPEQKFSTIGLQGWWFVMAQKYLNRTLVRQIKEIKPWILELWKGMGKEKGMQYAEQVSQKSFGIYIRFPLPAWVMSNSFTDLACFGCNRFILFFQTNFVFQNWSSDGLSVSLCWCVVVKTSKPSKNN